MDRRNFLAASLATVANTVANPNFATSQVSDGDLTNRIIDAHCHIFNATDLPIVGFLDKVVIPNYPEVRAKIKDYNNAVIFYLRFLSDWLQDKGRTANSETRLLREILAGTTPKPSPTQIAEREISSLELLIIKLQNLRAPLPNTPTRERWLADFAPTVLIGLMHREAFPDSFRVKGYSTKALNDNSDDAFTRQVWQPPHTVAEYLYKFGTGPITFYTKWALQCTRNRFELADQLYQINRRRSLHVTPAIVDFSKWLDVDDPTPITDQIDVMALISQQKQPNNGLHIHGFVAFDPLRQAIHEKLKKPDEQSPLAIAQRAVEEKGFIGIKLYPPMGFRATDNALLENAFPCSVRFGRGSPGVGAACAGRTNNEEGLGNEPGKALDDVLMKLFAWCATNNVPILSHTRNSFGTYGPAEGYAKRASPEYWEKALRSFPNLRVNMAHFGNFDNAFDGTEVRMDWIDKTLEYLIGNIWKRAPESYVYADISYFSSILDAASCKNDAKCKREQIKLLMIKFRSDYPMGADRLIFGTDWIMTGLEPDFPSLDAKKQYPDIVTDFLYHDVGFGKQEIENIMFNNAVRFLGLGKNDRLSGARGRLEKFYSDAHLDPSWMNAFDA